LFWLVRCVKQASFAHYDCVKQWLSIKSSQSYVELIICSKFHFSTVKTHCYYHSSLCYPHPSMSVYWIEIQVIFWIVSFTNFQLILFSFKCLRL
jgi:hypothetical protein